MTSPGASLNASAPAAVREVFQYLRDVAYMIKAFDMIALDQLIFITSGYYKRFYPEIKDCPAGTTAAASVSSDLRGAGVSSHQKKENKRKSVSSETRTNDISISRNAPKANISYAFVKIVGLPGNVRLDWET